MRLTYKYEKSNDYGSVKLKNLPPDPVVGRLSYLDDAWQEQRNKLGQLEDIEEELEMPVDKFFQALFGSAKMLKVWCIDTHKGLQEVFLSGFENHETARYFNAFNIDIGSTTLGLSQYGKTWALTKEELEK